uniref:Leucine-rich repeats and WD repeat domain containing 1 n=1 Tax=Nothobranchius kadleci TaxID=1051664 RepID=A0A1A8EFC2_NOTKA
MENVTEKLLLEKGSPKTNKLEQIKTLNLSKMALKHGDLPVKLLSRLQSLERWDLSGNRLQELPKNLKLPALRYLDLTNNQMEDVTTLESLSSLEELKMDDNFYITISDSYKLMVLLPKLRIYNNKDVSTTASHLRYVFSDNLRTRIVTVWERSFSLPDPITAGKMSDLEKNFVNAARHQVKFGPSSVSDFTKWRVEILAKEHLRSLTQPKEDFIPKESAEATKTCVISSPSKRKQTKLVTDDKIILTPRKKLRVNPLESSAAEDSPRKSRRVSLRTDGAVSTPTRGQARTETPRKRNNVAYGEFRASRKALSVLCFNHNQGNFFFTGSYDNKIIMWDIGGVDSSYNFKVVQLLVMEVSATPLHICLPPTSPGSHLLTASDDGLHCFNTQLGTSSSTKRSNEMEITFPIYEEEDKEHDYHTIDGLSFLTDDIIASKSHMHCSIYLWSWSRTRSQRPNKESRSVCAVVLAELQWASTNIPYLALNTCPGRAYIACGDDKGRIWTYHVTNLPKNSFQIGKPIPPTQVLEWPSPTRKGLGLTEGPSINSVAMDPELRYLVALTDKNMVIVWRREESS